MWGPRRAVRTAACSEEERPRARKRRLGVRDRLLQSPPTLPEHLRVSRDPRAGVAHRNRRSPLARPELPVIVVMGDGDCFSIGGNHWLHAIRYNIDALVLVLDNEVYALTKMQASPTTPDGWKTNTTPEGNLPSADESTERGDGDDQRVVRRTDGDVATFTPRRDHRTRLEPSRSVVRAHSPAVPGVHAARRLARAGVHFPVVFLESKDGIPVHPSLQSRGPTQPHDHLDINEAQRVAVNGRSRSDGAALQRSHSALVRGGSVESHREARPSDVHQATRCADG